MFIFFSETYAIILLIVMFPTYLYVLPIYYILFGGMLKLVIFENIDSENDLMNTYNLINL